MQVARRASPCRPALGQRGDHAEMAVLVVRIVFEHPQVPGERGVHVAGHLAASRANVADRDEVELAEPSLSGRRIGHRARARQPGLAGRRRHGTCRRRRRARRRPVRAPRPRGGQEPALVGRRRPGTHRPPAAARPAAPRSGVRRGPAAAPRRRRCPRPVRCANSHATRLTNTGLPSTGPLPPASTSSSRTAAGSSSVASARSSAASAIANGSRIPHHARHRRLDR